MPSRAAKHRNKSIGASKKSMKRRSLDDDSWMPEGWVKEVHQRPFKGKFPGHLDKKYYAPGVRRAFRSKVEALRYIEKQEIKEALFDMHNSSSSCIVGEPGDA